MMQDSETTPATHTHTHTHTLLSTPVSPFTPLSILFVSCLLCPFIPLSPLDITLGLQRGFSYHVHHIRLVSVVHFSLYFLFLFFFPLLFLCSFLLSSNPPPLLLSQECVAKTETHSSTFPAALLLFFQLSFFFAFVFPDLTCTKRSLPPSLLRSYFFLYHTHTPYFLLFP